MYVTTRKRLPGELEFGIIYGAIAIVALGAAKFLPALQFIPSCVFHRMTGIACPTCGSTRSLVRLSHGDVLGSLAMNPLISVCFLFLLWYFFYSIIALLFKFPRIGLTFSPLGKRLVRYVLILLVLINWMYLVVTL